MSTLWTPGGERPVPGPGAPPPGETDGPSDEELAERVHAELSEARQRLAQVPAAQVVANHAMGLYELAAIHLGSRPPKFDEASLAIDAMAALVDGLGARLGESAIVLRDALAQIRLAFVQVKSSAAPAQ